MARQGASAHDPLKTPTENDAGIRCVLLYPINGTPRIHATVSVWNGALHIGVGFMATRPKNAPQEMGDLEGSLRHEGLRPERDPKGREHWLSSKPCDVILNERGFLIDVASDPTFVADKIVEPRVTLLRKHGQEMVSLDTAL